LISTISIFPPAFPAAAACRALPICIGRGRAESLDHLIRRQRASRNRELRPRDGEARSIQVGELGRVTLIFVAATAAPPALWRPPESRRWQPLQHAGLFG